MEYKDIVIDGKYWCKVGGKWTVVVVQAATNKSTYRAAKTKFIVAKADDLIKNGIRISLPKPRSPKALYPYNETNPIPPQSCTPEKEQTQFRRSSKYTVHLWRCQWCGNWFKELPEILLCQNICTDCQGIIDENTQGPMFAREYYNGPTNLAPNVNTYK